MGQNLIIRAKLVQLFHVLVLLLCLPRSLRRTGRRGDDVLRVLQGNVSKFFSAWNTYKSIYSGLHYKFTTTYIRII